MPALPPDDQRTQAPVPDPLDLSTGHSTDVVGAALLVVCSIGALVWANSPWQSSYESVLSFGQDLATGGMALDLTLHSLINDGLMAVFFLTVGLEVKRELVAGDLRDRRTAALPTIAAAGGMIVPAAIYALVNAGSTGAPGWGIPMATDIAFALGVVALLGRRIPPMFRLFLLTLAIVDDIGAIVVIAIFYTGDLEPLWLLGAGLAAVAIGLAHRLHVHDPWVHLLLGVLLWYLTYRSGVHATIAGVVAGVLATAHGPNAVAARWEHRLAPLVAFVILPLFALANAGVHLDTTVLTESEPRLVAVGTMLGLVAGKFLGVFGATWLAVRLRLATLPTGLGWGHLAGVAGLAGIGFTVSLFVASLAFEADPALESAAKLGVLIASVLAASVTGLALARRSADPDGAPER